MMNYYQHQALDPSQPRTYYESLFSRPVATKAEYLRKLESLIFQEKSIGIKANPTYLFLIEKLKTINKILIPNP